MKVQVGYKGEWPTTETDIVRLTIDGVEFQITAESSMAKPETGRIEILKTGDGYASMQPLSITPVVSNKVILA